MLHKKITAGVMASLILIQPGTTFAADLSGAFQSLLGPTASLTANAPSRFNSSARTGFSAGGVEFRVPRSSTAPTLFTASMPSISAGCNGISAHFGGFSFISGAEFVKLLKQIASGAALGFVSSLVMKTLCPACEAIVQELKAAAQLAAQLAKNSCAIGQKAGRDFMDGLTSSPDAAATAGAGIKTATNQSSDFSAGYDNLMSGLNSVTATIKDFNDSWGGKGAGAPGAVAPNPLNEQCLSGGGTGGNQSWRRLGALNNPKASADEVYRQKLMLINITGALLTYRGENDEVSCVAGNGEIIITTEDSSSKFCAPRMDANKLVDYFMCGTPGALNTATDVSSRVKEYCQTSLPDASKSNEVWVCEKGDGECDKLIVADASNIFKGSGFLHEVNALLTEAVRRVANNEALYSGTGDAKGQELVRLINSAPYPLYQAINAAAVYPSAALDLLDTMSTLIAEQFAYAYLDEATRMTGRESSSLCISEKEVTNLMEFLSGLRTIASNRKSQTAQHFAVQQALHEQIRSLNIGIQRQVLSSQMLSNNAGAANLNGAISRSIGK